MTVLVFERHAVNADRREAYEEALAAHLETIRQAPGALWADAARAFDDEPSYIVLSEWRTEADADAFAVVRAAFAEKVDVMLRGDTTLRRFGPAATS